MTASDGELARAVAAGNIPTLQLVLAQLTGRIDWLRGEFTPSRTVALNDNDDAGLDEDHQRRIQEAVLAEVTAIRDGKATLRRPPADDELIAMLSASLGEEVPLTYGPLMSEEGGFRRRPALTWHGERPAGADDLHVLIIGAGAAGIAAAARLGSLGIDFTIVERKSQVGGVWRDNVYPGAGVDTPAHIYSYSFAPRNWSRYYAKQPEVLTYLREVAEEYGVTARTRYDTDVERVTWDEDAQVWVAELDHATDGPSTLHANVVMTCVGTLSEPSIPSLPGADTFQGKQFHSARWDTSFDPQGKKVAIIGTGATAMQIVPAIADAAEVTTVFQRTPQWVAPNANYLRFVSDDVRLLMDQVPFYAAFYRLRLIWQFQDKLLETLRRDPSWAHPNRSVNEHNDRHREFLTATALERLGEDAETFAELVVPDYPPYSKRILMDNEWFDTIRRPDVVLVPQSATRLDERHVIDSAGTAHEVDAVVYATGFQAAKMLSTVNVVGRGGVSLRDVWGDDDASAYLGVTVPDFPNLFVIGGPHTTPAHGGSALYIAECAIGYAVDAMVDMVERSIASIEVRPDVFEKYNEDVDAEHATLVWTHPGTDNWYRNSRGRVINALPWTLMKYRADTESFTADDYLTVSRDKVAQAVR
ncbi:NAD(P)/FAD-dependent oxidoreductase [Gordonia sp. zg691]|uniref:NAD(P)/FAD-dependent oxidoreductase n=1 Tax=Gordonia jinghuaiqii TaxID=2758710 RepID=A0A7D7LUD1_9ACTN|nr:NAD(P)/FAD-dependent oxidoreductase [Gordonia jinghuaiqii]MCR5978951.1 NAD(P)-binding protein [Gordonia jinghuaiqii]QMT03663.1 NAD(P)/FAD-dependent oxidoreductase [Gordonia jinghuaiqii]